MTVAIDFLLDRLEAHGPDPIWINRLPRDRVQALAAAAAGPLAGRTFAIKDNIDLAGVPTTAACPEFGYTPERSAPVVERLLRAGAVPLGKTNLDQFATGLVGVRSPYGVPVNPYDPSCIPGGSSSGSAVAVAAGWCDFALGTDTAGSGRVPAACNALVGFKPTRGLLSTRGVVPACRSLDCVSVFTRTVAAAAEVAGVMVGFDPEDPFSRPSTIPAETSVGAPRLGVPRADQLEFFGDAAAERLFAAAVQCWRERGAQIVTIDFAPFLEAARLLYEGPWVAERFAAIRDFLEARPESLHPVTREIISGARCRTAVSVFEATYRLAALKRQTETIWREVNALLTPTVGTLYSVAEVLADPIRLNSNLGYYTNYVNLLDLCALALPAGRLPQGRPWGVTLVAPAFCDDRLLRLGAMFRGEAPPASVLLGAVPTTRLVVCGAHLSGLPLNGQLLAVGARLRRSMRTAPHYRLFALPDTEPAKPGLVRVTAGGAAIEVEEWELPLSAYGALVAAIPAPLGVGGIMLEDGSQVQGFLCEGAATSGALDITRFGGWRRYLAAGA